MTKWNKTTSERYYEMLGVLPPEIMTGTGFLVGEPMTHQTCSVTGRIAPVFSAFAKDGDDYYEAKECLSVVEFKNVKLLEVVQS